jgi:hypothetical protein
MPTELERGGCDVWDPTLPSSPPDADKRLSGSSPPLFSSLTIMRTVTRFPHQAECRRVLCCRGCCACPRNSCTPLRSRLTRRIAFGASGSSSRRPNREASGYRDFPLIRRARHGQFAASALTLLYSRKRSRRLTARRTLTGSGLGLLLEGAELLSRESQQRQGWVEDGRLRAKLPERG